jgi:hypothetical protein
MSNRNASLKERFLAKVDENWQWKAGKNKEGYGQVKVNGKQTGAHCIAYELFIGPIPEGAFVLHSCDDPGCVSPEHLKIGDHQKNMRDRMNHGHYKIFGVDNPNAILVPEKVAEIRKMYESGKYTEKKLGELYGVSQTTVSRIVLKQTWQEA